MIYKVDGELMAGVDLTLLVNNYVKGEEGSQVAITVYREDTGEYVDLTVTRRFIDVQTVSGKMLEDGIGYVSVIEFDEVTAKQFKDKIEDLRGQGMERLIIDLRDNPGGELNTVVSMADYLIGTAAAFSPYRINMEMKRFTRRRTATALISPWSCWSMKTPRARRRY